MGANESMTSFFRKVFTFSFSEAKMWKCNAISFIEQQPLIQDSQAYTVCLETPANTIPSISRHCAFWAAWPNTLITVRKISSDSRELTSLHPAVLGCRKRTAALVNLNICKVKLSLFRHNGRPVWLQVCWESLKWQQCLADSFHFSLFMLLIICQLNENFWILSTDLTFKNQMSESWGFPFKLTQANNVISMLTKETIFSLPLCSFQRLWVNEGHTWSDRHMCLR